MVLQGFNPTLLLVLNLGGTFVFGLSGGLAAVRARLDVLGVAVEFAECSGCPFDGLHGAISLSALRVAAS